MSPYEEAARLLMAPLGRTGISGALAALRGAAVDGYVPAAAALSAVVARELGFPGHEEFLFSVDSVGDLLSATHVPSLIRLYALGFVPGAVLAHHEAIGTDHKHDLLEAAYRSLRLCVRRDSPLQDEALRALLVSLAVLGSKVGPGTNSQLVRNVVRTIVYEARVVPGRNMNTRFEVGRGLLSRKGGVSALMFSAFHEIGHHVLFVRESRVETTTRVGDDEDLRALDEMVPQLMEAAERQGSAPLFTADGRRQELPSGVFVLCTIEQLPGTSRRFIHVSFSLSGEPIGLIDAAGCALRFLRALGIQPEDAAAARSSSGIFHVGFFSAQTSAQTDARATQDSAGPSDGAAWIEALRASGRLGQQEREIQELLLGESTPVRLYTQSLQSMRDARFCALINSDSLGGAEPYILHAFALQLVNADIDPATREAVFASGPLGAAVRCADPVTARHVLAPGPQMPTEDPRTPASLVGLGSSCAIVRDRTGIGYVGATAAGVRGVVGELASAGFDVDDPLDDLRSTLLMEAAARSPEWLDLLLDLGADPMRADARGQTPLILAAQSGHDDAVTTLLAAGADVDGRDNDGRSALMYAVEYMRPDVVELLLRHGADPDLTTNDGVAAVHSAVETPIESVREQLVALLVEAGAALDEETNDGMTPMALAEANNHESTVAQLRAFGATA